MKKYVFLNKEGVVANIIEIDESQLDIYVKVFENVTLWEGEIPHNVSYQFKIEGDKLVYDPEIEDVQGEIAEPEPDPRDEIIAQQQADIDYLLMLVE